MGKASRNARNSLTAAFTRLQNTGKSIFQIAMTVKCDPKMVFLHYSPDGDGRRRNEGLVAYLRKSGAHWTLIAAAQGMSYDEIKDYDSSGNRPSGPWLQGLTLLSSDDDEPSEPDSLIDEPTEENLTDDAIPLEPEVTDEALPEATNGQAAPEFFVGQKVRLAEDGTAARRDLQQFFDETMVILHIDGDRILIGKLFDNELEQDFEGHRIVGPDEIVGLISVVEIKRGDEVLYTQLGESPRLARITSVRDDGDAEVQYSLVLNDDSSYALASLSEIEATSGRPVSTASDQRFYFKESGCNAVGIADENGGVTVLKGSIGKRKTSKGKASREHICDDRLGLLEDGKAIISGETIELTEDHHFPSFHRAGSCLIGYNTNGKFWKTLEGKTYSQTREGLSPRQEDLFRV